MKTVRKIWEILRISLQNILIYPAELGLQIVNFCLRMSLILLLTQAIYAVAPLPGGITFEALALATVMAQTISMSRPGMIGLMDQDIKSGQIAAYLLLPFPYIWIKFFELLGTLLLRITLFGVSGFLLVWYFIGSIPGQASGFMPCLILLLGWAIFTFFAYIAIGLLAFFVEDATGFGWIFGKFNMILGWNIIAIPYLPKALQSIAYLTPFPYAGYVSGLLFSHFDSQVFLRGLLIQSFWIVCAIGASVYIFSLGRKRLSLNGW